jgi:hypothetical protein
MIAHVCKGSFTCQVREDRILEIVIYGELLPSFARELVCQIRQAGPVAGLLLDVRNSIPLSMIRLSGCVDALSRLSLPMAVVFLWTQQKDLAILLHPALLYRQRISYFTTVSGALAYLHEV